MTTKPFKAAKWTTAENAVDANTDSKAGLSKRSTSMIGIERPKIFSTRSTATDKQTDVGGKRIGGNSQFPATRRTLGRVTKVVQDDDLKPGLHKLNDRVRANIPGPARHQHGPHCRGSGRHDSNRLCCLLKRALEHKRSHIFSKSSYARLEWFGRLFVCLPNRTDAPPGKACIVTGGLSGIGLAIAEALLAKVVCFV
jgi:hypothetical protein